MKKGVYGYWYLWINNQLLEVLLQKRRFIQQDKQNIYGITNYVVIGKFNDRVVVKRKVKNLVLADKAVRGVKKYLLKLVKE